MSSTVPAAPTHNPVLRIARDLMHEASERGNFPPGEYGFSARRTHQLATDPLPVLLDCYERYGPVFTVRTLHLMQIFALGPEANHYITVSHAANFRWRDGGFAELQPLLGDGLLTIDGAYHRRARKIMLPGFHRTQIAAAAEVMTDEIATALDHWRPGMTFDLYAWARTLAMRIAMKALMGLDPDGGGVGARAAEQFERALTFYGTDYHMRVVRGPGSPWAKMLRARAELNRIVYGEIERRRRAARNRHDADFLARHPVGKNDILDMLLAATDDEGHPLSDREVRDQAITLLFAGHDTTTSTVSFLFYELARHPHEMDLLRAEQQAVLGDRPPQAQDLAGGMPRLEMVLDETLRLYPPAWIGPRRAVESFELAGVSVPAGAPVNYSSWASHRLPDVWHDPEAFVPERFAPEAKAKLPKGAYVPFGGGSRTCIGMRFGEMEIRAIATMILQRHRLELVPGRTMSIRQMPTLSPRHGLPVTVRDP